MAKIINGRLFLAVLALSSLAVSIWAHFTPRFPGDLILTLALQSHDNHLLQAAMDALSAAFTPKLPVGLIVVIVTVAAAATLFIWRRMGKRQTIVVVVTVFLGDCLTYLTPLLKEIVNRPRPTPDLVRVLSHETNAGFPSGHAIFSFVMLGLLAYATYHSLRSNVLRAVALVCLMTVVLLVGVSRVYLGAHWPSDVVGGWLIGGVFLAALIRFYRHHES